MCNRDNGRTSYACFEDKMRIQHGKCLKQCRENSITLQILTIGENLERKAKIIIKKKYHLPPRKQLRLVIYFWNSCLLKRILVNSGKLREDCISIRTLRTLFLGRKWRIRLVNSNENTLYFKSR